MKFMKGKYDNNVHLCQLGDLLTETIYVLWYYGGMDLNFDLCKSKKCKTFVQTPIFYIKALG